MAYCAFPRWRPTSPCEKIVRVSESSHGGDLPKCPQGPDLSGLFLVPQEGFEPRPGHYERRALGRAAVVFKPFAQLRPPATPRDAERSLQNSQTGPISTWAAGQIIF
jgi:hypothetical protein